MKEFKDIDKVKTELTKTKQELSNAIDDNERLKLLNKLEELYQEKIRLTIEILKEQE